MCGLQAQQLEKILNLKLISVSSYHQNLLSDWERLTGFHEAIKKNAKGIVYDIGAGTGIFSVMMAPFVDFIYTVEIDPKVAECARWNLRSFKNVSVINKDVKEFSFPKKADLIICEMLDTCLIEEEQVTVINSLLKYLKKDGEMIPKKLINGAEPVFMNAENICYECDERPNHDVLGNMTIYGEVDFKNEIEEEVDVKLEFEINKDGILSGIKIISFTLLASDIICGPTPMLNPPLFVPTDKIKVERGDTIEINLSYIMGGGLDSIRTEITKIFRRSCK